MGLQSPFTYMTMDIKIILLISIYFIVKSVGLQCYVSRYEWEMYHIQPMWGGPYLNVTSGPIDSIRTCETEDANVCYESHGRDGWTTKGCGMVDDVGNIHVELDDGKFTRMLNSHQDNYRENKWFDGCRTIYIYHQALYTKHCLCAGDLCNGAESGGKAAILFVVITTAVSMMLTS